MRQSTINKFLVILLCIAVTTAKAQDTAGVKNAMLQLNMALVAKDTATIKKLVHPQVSFGHSNGWVQAYSNVINDLCNGRLQYRSIEEQGVTSLQLTKSTAIVRNRLSVQGVVNGNTAFDMHLYVLQVWVKVKRKWVLLARQSIKAG
jgi:hypothetical protein